ncbi:alpha-mannosidase 2c1 [bacterium]|nr:alpha-mannosidase 2c1 [bacterium]
MSDDKQATLTITRFERFMDRLKGHVLGETKPLDVTFGWSKEPISFEDRESHEFKPIKEGDTWAAAWESAWFHMTGSIPAEWTSREVVAHLDVGGEGLVVAPDGRALQGITNGSIFDPNFSRDLVPLFDACKGGEHVELWVEGASNSLFGVFTEMDPDQKSPKRYGQFDAQLAHAELAIFNRPVWELLLDCQTIRGLIKRLPENGVRRARLIALTTRIVNLYNESPEKAVEVREMLAPELYRPAEASNPTALAIGHAHIDTAWLWPLRETIRKCARTFSSQLDLIDRYPGYLFGASQPQHYAFVKEHYPELFERIRKAVADGSWEVQGAMWVEADCNLAGGEALVRQVLHGKNFFRDEFDIEVDNLWLPDVFGYSAALPQILQRAGVPYFLTQKISWNQFNDFPHTTFHWRGIDGSEVLAHFPPENTYNSLLDTEFLIPGMTNFREKDRLPEFMSLFGVGDGGGGPKAESIELGQRMENLEGAPKVRFGNAKEFFARLNEHRDQLPTWVGELYLELHRGTLTTQAKVKQGNRNLEQELRTTELLHAAGNLADYPLEALDQLWKTTLLYQFHDILPGSSITEVYRVTHEAHDQALADLAQLQRTSSPLLETDTAAATLLNTSGTRASMTVELPDNWAGHDVVDGSGASVALQQEDETTLARVELAPWSLVTLKKGAHTTVAPCDQSTLLLENDLVRYRFNDQGRLVELFDRRSNRSMLKPDGEGNLLTLYQDRPNNWDAWDVDLFYEEAVIEQARLVETIPLPNGPVRQGVMFRFEIGSSTIEQVVTLDEGDTMLRFETTVDWQESHHMLRVSFPTSIQASEATFDIQYGHVKRPTHRNTSWDLARFEVAGQWYADLSERDVGLALLNDCKYGYKVFGGTLDLNLLRSPSYPDPDADRGQHRFTYALLPHEGDLVGSDVFERAAQLNGHLKVIEGMRARADRFPWQLEGEGITLEVVKRAEKERAWVLRLAETRGRHSTGILTLDLPAKQWAAVDLMEWNLVSDKHPLEGPISLELSPFEIRTLKVW